MQKGASLAKRSESKVHRTTLLTARIFSVDHIRLKGPDGRMIERDIVVHPGAAVIVPVLGDGRIVMIRNVRPAVGKRLLELPAGTLEPNEPPRTTAARELIEETGYKARRLRVLGGFFMSPGILTERMHAFLATELTLVGQDLQDSEDIRVWPVEADRLRKMLTAGKLEDAKTIAALAIYFARNGAA